MAQVGYAGTVAPVRLLLGQLAAARGERDAAVRHLNEAIAYTEERGLRLFEAQARKELEALPS
jgi:hypothetical protein